MSSKFEECFDLESLLNEDNDEELEGGRECRDGSVGNYDTRIQDDGRNFDQDDYFPLPLEVEMKCSPKVSRKRKQKLNELTDIEELSSEEDDPDYQVVNYRQRSGRLPLYLLNPEDFPEDPQKQLQIRRARTTYRHHQEIKERIVKLTEENQLLREHVNQLKSKIVDLSRCGCERNATADLSVLDTVIPVVPQGMCVRRRSSKPVVAKPSSISKSEPQTIKKHDRKTVDVTSSVSNAVGSGTVEISPVYIICNDLPQTTKPTVTVDMTKPLINLTASRLANFKSNTLSSANVVTPKLSKPLINWVLNNGTQRIKSTVATTAPVPLSAIVKNEIITPAPATAKTPVKSRIVFAKKGSSRALKTASQLYFRTKGLAKQDSSITDCLSPQL